MYVCVASNWGEERGARAGVGSGSGLPLIGQVAWEGGAVQDGVMGERVMLLGGLEMG